MYISEINIKLPEIKKDSLIELSGFGYSRECDAGGDNLMASMIALQLVGNRQLIICSIDTLFVDDQLSFELSKGFESVEFMFFATHTHNAPGLYINNQNGLGVTNIIWRSAVVFEIREGIKKLLEKNKNKTELYYAEKKVSLNINRRLKKDKLNFKSLMKGRIKFNSEVHMSPNKNGLVDKRIKLFIFGSKDSPRVILWTLAAHPAFYPKKNEISPDFPGYVRNHLLKKYGESVVVLFLPGFAGSSIPNPIRLSDLNIKSIIKKIAPGYNYFPSFTFGGYKNWINLLIFEVDNLISTAVKINVDKNPVCKILKINSIFIDKIKGAVDVNVTALKFSEKLCIVGFSGEMLSEWSKYCDDIAHGIFSGYMQGVPIYIPMHEQIIDGGYESIGFKDKFGLDGDFSLSIDSLFYMLFSKLRKIYDSKN